MVRNLRTVAITAIILLLIGAVGALGYAGIQTYKSLRAALGCEITIKQKIASPNAELVAVVYEKDCGATTPENTQVGIEKLVSSLSAESADELISFIVVHGRHHLAIKWLDNDHIQIALPRNEKIYRQHPRAEGVSVTYRWT